MDVNETVVGLWLEQQGYSVRYRVPYALDVGTKDIDIVALHPTTGRVLAVEVKGRHTEKVTPGYVKSWPKLFDFAGGAAARPVADLVGDRPVK